MSRFLQVLDPTLRESVDPRRLSDQTGIPFDRIELLLNREASPSVWELGELAEALATPPSYLIRERPVVLARRASGTTQTDPSWLLERFDLHVEAYSRDLNQPAVEDAFPTREAWGARGSGEKWAERKRVRWQGPEAADALFDLIEEEMRIPILVWPVQGAPFGATLRLNGILAIWINSYQVPGSQQRFTLAHELGHIQLAHIEHSHVELTATPEEAERAGTVTQRKYEEHANAFGGGVLYDYNRIKEHWDGDTTPESVAHIAAGLGISYAAALAGMSQHLNRKVGRLPQSLWEASPTDAFRSAGHAAYVEWYRSLIDRRRLPSILPRSEVLERFLTQAGQR